MTKVYSLADHKGHPFYRDAENYRYDIREKQIQKGYEKYPEPFNPDSWTPDELAAHAMQENVDQGHYIYGMKVKMAKMEAQINSLHQDKASLLMRVKVLKTRLQRFEEDKF